MGEASSSTISYAVLLFKNNIQNQRIESTKKAPEGALNSVSGNLCFTVFLSNSKNGGCMALQQWTIIAIILMLGLIG